MRSVPVSTSWGSARVSSAERARVPPILRTWRRPSGTTSVCRATASLMARPRAVKVSVCWPGWSTWIGTPRHGDFVRSQRQRLGRLIAGHGEPGIRFHGQPHLLGLVQVVVYGHGQFDTVVLGQPGRQLRLDEEVLEDPQVRLRAAQRAVPGRGHHADPPGGDAIGDGHGEARRGRPCRWPAPAARTGSRGRTGAAAARPQPPSPGPAR